MLQFALLLLFSHFRSYENKNNFNPQMSKQQNSECSSSIWTCSQPFPPCNYQKPAWLHKPAGRCIESRTFAFIHGLTNSVLKLGVKSAGNLATIMWGYCSAIISHQNTQASIFYSMLQQVISNVFFYPVRQCINFN